MYLEIIGSIKNVATIAVVHSIRELKRLQKQFGKGRWRKLKGIAMYDCAMVKYLLLKYIGTKHMELERKSLKSNKYWIKSHA